MHRPTLQLAMVVLLTLTLAGCATPPEGSWRLVEFRSSTSDTGDVALPEPVTMTITGDEVAGSSGCNTYFGVASVDDDLLRFTSVAVTEMYCDDQEVMATEARFLDALVTHEWQVEELPGGIRLQADTDIHTTMEFADE